jgi:predicted DNA-binding protein with PD1-like motif
MRSQKSKAGPTHILRIDRGEEIVGTIKKFCADNKIRPGTVQGIGAVKKAVIGLFETGAKKYYTTELSGDYEITSLLGNVTTRDGAPYLHLHITLSDPSYHVFGGHLTSAVVSGTCEIFISEIEGGMGRVFDEDVGLNVMDL